jgi:type I restriction enzyme S subunit
MDIPKHWSNVSLKDLVLTQKGKKPLKQSKKIFSDSVPYLDIEAIEKNNITQYADKHSTVLANENDILIVVDGSRSGLTGRGIKGAVGSTIMCLTPLLVNSEFLFFFLRLNYTFFNKNTKGTSIPHLDLELFYNLKVPLPPIEEQARIVAELKTRIEISHLDFQNSENELETIKNFRKAILEGAFSGELTKKWRRESNSSDWKVYSINELFSVETGATPSRSNNLYWKNGNINWVKSGEVRNNEIHSTEEFITDLAIKETNAKIFPINTILIAMYGEGKTRGQTGILKIKAATNQAIAALVSKGIGGFTEKFVYYYIRSQYEKLRNQADGTAQPNLNLSIIKSWQIKLPSIEEQSLIESQLDQAFLNVDVLEKHTEITEDKNRLEESISQMAFQGKISLYNSIDEPVSELLKRIEIERKSLEEKIKEEKKANLDKSKHLKMKLTEAYLKTFVQENFSERSFSSDELLESLGIEGGKNYIKLKDILFSILQEKINESEEEPFLEAIYDYSKHIQLFKIKTQENETSTT